MERITRPLPEIVMDRLDKLGENIQDLSKGIAKSKGMEWYKGRSGVYYLILDSKKPVPLEDIPHWRKALRYKPGLEDAEIAEFNAATDLHNASLHGGGAGKRVVTKAREVQRDVNALASANRELLSENVRLAAEVERLEQQLAKLRASARGG